MKPWIFGAGLAVLAAGSLAFPAVAGERPAAARGAEDEARAARSREKEERRVEKDRERHDLNRDGRIDEMETEAARNPWYRERGLLLDQPWERLADSDGDGKIGAAELYAFKRRLLDDDGDGALSPDDYRRFFKRVRSLAQSPREKRFDRSGDGFLDGGEIVEMLKDRLAGLKGSAKRPVECKFDRLFDGNADGLLAAEDAASIEVAIDP